MRQWISAIALVVLAAHGAIAGSVITANLPANTAIVNINATKDGSGSFNGANQDFWYQPFSVDGSASLLEYTIQPGTYSFKLTNPTLAAGQFPALTTPQRASIYTAWTYNSPWATDYMVFDVSAATNAAIPQLFAGAIMPVTDYPGFASDVDAFNHAQSEGFANIIRNSPGGRYSGTPSTTRTFATAQTLVFTIPDNGLSDNQGGVSIVIAPATGGVVGDYNNNGKVDAADYAVWRNNNNTSATLPNDSTPGTVNNADYTVWRSHFGQTAGAGSGIGAMAAVPEPTSCALVLIAGLSVAVRRRRV